MKHRLVLRAALSYVRRMVNVRSEAVAARGPVARDTSPLIDALLCLLVPGAALLCEARGVPFDLVLVSRSAAGGGRVVRVSCGSCRSEVGEGVDWRGLARAHLDQVHLGRPHGLSVVSEGESRA